MSNATSNLELDIIIKMIAAGEGAKISIEQVQKLTAEIGKLESQIAKIEKAGGRISAATDARLDQLKSSLAQLGDVSLGQQNAAGLFEQLTSTYAMRRHLGAMLGQLTGSPGLGMALGVGGGAAAVGAGFIALEHSASAILKYFERIDELFEKMKSYGNLAEQIAPSRVFAIEAQSEVEAFDIKLQHLADTLHSVQARYEDLNQTARTARRETEELEDANLKLAIATIHAAEAQGQLSREEALEKEGGARAEALKRKHAREIAALEQDLSGAQSEMSEAGAAEEFGKRSLTGVNARVLALRKSKAKADIDAKNIGDIGGSDLARLQKMMSLLDYAEQHPTRHAMDVTEIPGGIGLAKELGVANPFRDIGASRQALQDKIDAQKKLINDSLTVQSIAEEKLTAALQERALIEQEILENARTRQKAEREAANLAKQITQQKNSHAEDIKAQADTIEAHNRAINSLVPGAEKFIQNRAQFGSNLVPLPGNLAGDTGAAALAQAFQHLLAENKGANAQLKALVDQLIDEAKKNRANASSSARKLTAP